MSDLEMTPTRNRSQPITRTWLQEQGAQGDDLDIFSKTFSESAELTRANLTRAAAAGLNLNWLASRILTVTAWEAYLDASSPVRQAYQDAAVTAWKNYRTVTTTAWQAYINSTAWRASIFAKGPDWQACIANLTPTLQIYEATTAPARLAYENAKATSWQTYQDALATALADVLELPSEEQPQQH